MGGEGCMLAGADGMPGSTNRWMLSRMRSRVAVEPSCSMLSQPLPDSTAATPKQTGNGRSGQGTWAATARTCPARV